MAGEGESDPLLNAIERLVQLHVSIRLGEVTREAGPALLRTIELELRRLGVSDDRLPLILQDVKRTADRIAAVRLAERQRDMASIPPEPRRVLPRAELTAVLHDAEHESVVPLTGAARDLLRIPVLEMFELTGEWSPVRTKESVATILETVRESQPSDLDRLARRRTSSTLLWAIHKQWCNIPPFCARVRGELE